MKWAVRILCVDDEPDILKVLQLSLQTSLTAEVIALSSGAEALALLRHDPVFDAIVLDARMPDMDGYTLCRTIRQELKITTPIVFLTASSEAGQRSKATDAGASLCLAKPFDPLTLGAQLQSVLPGHAFVSDDISPEDRFSKLRQAYIDKLSVYATELAQWCDTCDRGVFTGQQEVRARAHQIAGTSGSFGLDDVSKSARLLDEALRNEDLPAVPTRVRHLVQAIGSTQP